MQSDSTSEFRDAVARILQSEGVEVTDISARVGGAAVEVAAFPTEQAAWSAFTRLPLEEHFFNSGEVTRTQAGFVLRVGRKLPE